jgi:hypothetical protein
MFIPASVFISTLVQILNSGGLGFCVYQISKVKRKTPEDKYYFLFWYSGALWWFFSALGTLFRPTRLVDLTQTLISICIIFMAIYIFSAFTYLLKRATQKKIFYLPAFIFITSFLIFYFPFLLLGQQSPGRPYFHLTVPGWPLLGHLFAPVIVIFLLFFAFSFSRKNGRREESP